MKLLFFMMAATWLRLETPHEVQSFPEGVVIRHESGSGSG